MPDRQEKRHDPYKNFNFIVAIGAVVAGIAAVALATKAVRRAKPEGTRRNSYWRLFG